MMKYVLSLLAVLALTAGLAVAQYPQSQQPDQSQPAPPTATPDSQQAPSSQAGSSSQDAQSQLQAAFQQDPTLANVTISQSGDEIELSGTVASQADKDKAEQLAKSHASNAKIKNNIKVSGGSESSSPSMPPK